MQRWEHKRVTIISEGWRGQWTIEAEGKKFKGKDTLKYIDNLGQEGWELVSMSVHDAPVWTELLWFKRPLQASKE